MTTVIYSQPNNIVRRIRRLEIQTAFYESVRLQRPKLTLDELLFNQLLSESIKSINNGNRMWNILPRALYKCPPNKWINLYNSLLGYTNTKKYFSN